MTSELESPTWFVVIVLIGFIALAVAAFLGVVFATYMETVPGKVASWLRAARASKELDAVLRQICSHWKCCDSRLHTKLRRLCKDGLSQGLLLDISANSASAEQLDHRLNAVAEWNGIIVSSQVSDFVRWKWLRLIIDCVYLEPSVALSDDTELIQSPPLRVCFLSYVLACPAIFLIISIFDRQFKQPFRLRGGAWSILNQQP